MTTTATRASRSGFRAPEKASEREHRRHLIEASPRRHETDSEGRTWLVVSLPDPGDIWVVPPALDGDPETYNGGHDGDQNTAQAAGPDEA